MSAIRRSLKVKIFLVFYRFIWLLCMPVVLCYLVYRSKHEPAYAQKLLERFGIGRTRKGSWVWIHAVSLGEFRSAIPLVDKLVERGERNHLKLRIVSLNLRLKIEFQLFIQSVLVPSSG